LIEFTFFTLIIIFFQRPAAIVNKIIRAAVFSWLVVGLRPPGAGYAAFGFWRGFADFSVSVYSHNPEISKSAFSNHTSNIHEKPKAKRPKAEDLPHCKADCLARLDFF